jgi:serine/threonine protein kinase
MSDEEVIFTASDSGKHYLVTEKNLGKGSFGAVYEGYEIEFMDKDEKKYKKLPTKYAIKQLLLKQPPNFERLSSVEKENVLSDMISMYKNEIKLYNKLSKSPHCYPGIVCIYDYYYNDFNKSFFIVMEYIDGKTLSESHIDIDKIEVFMKEMITILQYIHSKGILHRDIKPDNIMITKDGQLKLIDLGFGCGMTSEHDIIRCREVKNAGTVSYMDPYLFLNPSYKVNGLSDIYSLGMTFLEILTDESSLPIYLVNKTKEEEYTKVKEKIKTLSLSKPYKIALLNMLNPYPDRPTSEQLLNYLDDFSKPLQVTKIEIDETVSNSDVIALAKSLKIDNIQENSLEDEIVIHHDLYYIEKAIDRMGLNKDDLVDELKKVQLDVSKDIDKEDLVKIKLK